MKTGLIICVLCFSNGLLAVTADLLFSEGGGPLPTRKGGGRTPRSVYVPAWFGIFVDLRYAPCSRVRQIVTSPTFREKYRPYCSLVTGRHLCSSILKDTSPSTRCQVRHTATALLDMCACPGSQTLRPVDGNWGAWRETVLRACSVTCGAGTETYRRDRQCDEPAPANGGEQCKGHGTVGPQTRNCQRGSCPVVPQPVDGGWTKWSAGTVSGSCSKTCGEGRRPYRRTRTCTNPSPANGGARCRGSNVSSVNRPCNERACPVNGQWTQWTVTSEGKCSRTCGGGTRVRERRRSCSDPPASGGGRQCPGSGREVTRFDCGEQSCPVAVIHGVWSKWADVPGPCSVTCGGGRQRVTRTRTCTNPAPSGGGRECPGNSTITTEGRDCNADVVCRQSACPSLRIVGGVSATSCSYPYLVGVLRSAQRRFSCGGTLISPSRVLTAAHCVYGVTTLAVEVGKHCRDADLNPNMVVINVVSVSIHPDYRHTAPNLLNDVAVLLLETAVVVTPCRALVTLSTTDQRPGYRAKCSTAGWGSDVYLSGRGTDDLRHVNLTVYDSADCLQEFKNIPRRDVDDNVMCAANGHDGGLDACQGDSGGPLMCEVDGSLVQVGIVSGGYGCADPGFPGLYTKVASFRSWIDAQLIS